MTDQKLTLKILKLETGDLEMNPFHFKASVSNFSIPVKESRTKREIEKKILIMLFSKRLPVDILT